jgi:hypothetical protein
MDSEGLDPKTIRNLGGIISLMWAAALSQKYVDSALPKPKLPRKLKKITQILYGGKPEWVGNVEAARKAGLAIEQSVAKVHETEPFVGLTAIKEERLPIRKSEALMNQ